MSPEFDKLKATVDALRATRADAVPRIVEGIRSLEATLRDTLGPDGVLAGLPNLGDKEIKLIGLVVRSPRKDRIRYPDAGDRRNVLVLRPGGELAIAEITSEIDPRDIHADEIDIKLRPVRDDELLASDVRAVIDTVEQAIRIHLNHVDKTTAQWRAAGDLAERLLQLLPEAE